MTKLDSIINEVKHELYRAVHKFPCWPYDAHHAVNILNEECGELVKEIVQLTYEPNKSSKEEVRKEAIQVAAMALRFLLSLDKYYYEPCNQHHQDTEE